MRCVLLTGLPGVGKSTACSKVMEMCKRKGLQVEGFITEELREGRARVGFDIVEIRAGAFGTRTPLARVGSDSPSVGKYTVKVHEFEELAFPVLDRLSKLSSKDNVVCILDEIGKMELFSQGFVSRMRKLLAAKPVPILCTIALYGRGFIAEAKRVPGIDLIEITEATRDAAPEDIMSRLLGNGFEEESIETPSFRSIRLDTSLREASERKSGGRRWQKVPSRLESDKEIVIPTSDSLSSASRIVLWLRNDLRVADNPLLQRALTFSRKRNIPLLPIFCFDPRDFSSDARTAFGSSKVGVFRRRFIEEAIADLGASFEQLALKLLVFEAAPELVLPLLVSKGDVVMVAREPCPEEVAAETRVKKSLDSIGAALDVVDDGGITTIFGPADLAAIGLKTGSQFPEDFREFYDACKASMFQICQQGLNAAPEKSDAAYDSITIPSELEGLQRTPASCAKHEIPSETRSPPIRGGETEAKARTKSWFSKGGLRTYKATFRHLLGDYSSRLSSHLAFGCISPRRLCVEALKTVRSGPHVEHFIYEMCWRDFFRHAAMRWGSDLFRLHGPLRSVGEASWKRDAKVEERWRTGMTGVPLIDAAMRELLATGYIGNLARQFVAAYLVEDLGLDWRIGADWFESTLVDYDPHSNWGQWARSAGVAPTNEAKRRRVGGYRYFDIALQLRDDEAAKYIRTWVPELCEIDDHKIFSPWLSHPRTLGDYPPSPMCSASLKKYFEDAGKEKHGDGKGQFARGGRNGKGGKGYFGSR